ncbi:hypothetical protein NVS55_12185 [Myxococcus stipitatus]
MLERACHFDAIQQVQRVMDKAMPGGPRKVPRVLDLGMCDELICAKTAKK